MCKDYGYGILEQFKEAEHHYLDGPCPGGAPCFSPRPVDGRGPFPFPHGTFRYTGPVGRRANIHMYPAKNKFF